MPISITSATFSNLNNLKNRLTNAVNSVGNRTIRWNFAIALLNSYQEEIYRVVGTVKARGGYAKFKFSYASESLGSGQEYWASLTPATIRRRLLRAGTTLPKDARSNPGQLYEEGYGYEFKIWQDTGDLKNSLANTEPWIYNGTIYAGLNPGKTPNYKGYSDMENGVGTKQPRRLFSAGARIFFSGLRALLQDPNSKLAAQIKSEYIYWLKQYGWRQK